MARKIVVTISREYGSGGREVGRQLAEKLGIPYYDKELLTALAQESGIDPELFKSVNAQIGFDNFYFTSDKKMTGPLNSLGVLGIHERIQKVQDTIIRRLAQESCVLVGRCSDYILRGDPDVISIFIRANLIDKKARAARYYGESVDNINEILLKIDTRRANYYNYFTDRIWGKPSNYDLVFSTSNIELEDAAEVMKTFIELRK